MTKKTFLLLLSFSLFISGCAATRGDSPQEKRAAVQNMKQEVLTDLYKVKPHTRSEISSAPGYAVFSNANINLLLVSFGGGYGVVESHKSGANTYMRMGEVGVGLGLGVKDFRAVLVFKNDDALQQFVDKGWEFGGSADAAAKAEDKGAAIGGEAVIDDVTIYQLTESGLALQATLKGTKFWKDKALN
jgi:lipid-binding SYLF domain-containing protein